MKKTYIKILSIFVVLALVFTACKKDDTEAPSVAIIGADMTIDLKTSFTDPGAKATDTKDGDITSKIVVTGTVDNTKAGVYTLTYSVSDAAGNSGDAKRTVTVRHTTATVAGAYAVSDKIGTNPATTYNDVITSVNSTDVTVTRFADYDNGVFTFKLSGPTNSIVTIPSQTVTCGTPPAATTESGTGTISADGKTITINYTETINSTTITGVETYTK